MSTDWNVYCRTCDSEHDFSGANHREELMHKLIRHAKVIGGLLPFMQDPSGWVGEIEFRTHYGPIDVAWFHEHAEHDLVPRDEYGRCEDECSENVVCECCGTRQRCTLPLKHDGAHKHQKPGQGGV